MITKPMKPSEPFRPIVSRISCRRRRLSLHDPVENETKKPGNFVNIKIKPRSAVRHISDASEHLKNNFYSEKLITDPSMFLNEINSKHSFNNRKSFQKIDDAQNNLEKSSIKKFSSKVSPLEVENETKKPGYFKKRITNSSIILNEINSKYSFNNRKSFQKVDDAQNNLEKSSIKKFSSKVSPLEKKNTELFDANHMINHRIIKKKYFTCKVRRLYLYLSIFAAVLIIATLAIVLPIVLTKKSADKTLCSVTCVNNGTCVNGNSCICTSQWTDETCATPICSSTCPTNQVCSSPGTCTCQNGWTGTGCTLAVCSPVCSNSGICSSPGTCTCPATWTGSQCTTPVCTTPCQNGGTCSSPNTCTCTAQWSGITCTIPVCTPPCLNYGVCSSPGTCFCPSSWTDSRCNTPVCSSSCQNGGICVNPNTCVCPSVWSGSTCATPVCTPPCSNGGICSSPGICVCPYTWTGARCTTPVCTFACQNGGSCINPDTCFCPSQWTGTTCATPVCSPSCANGGVCSSPGVCTCTVFWGGSSCTTPVCSPACSNGGTCIGGVNNCTCPSTWTDLRCTTPVCNPSCQNGGTCISPSTCSCTSQWTDATCSTPICSPSCSNGGTCSSPNVCTCASYWAGSTCTTPVCTPTCSNGGTCVGGTNVCTCPSGWTDTKCTTPVCSPSCQNGGTCGSPGVCTCPTYWNGSSCSIPVCIPDCQNGGTCNGGVNNCNCPMGYSGSYCQNSPSCFYGKDMVRLVDGGERSIENLQVGDRIWSISRYGTTLFEDEVFLMPDNGPNKSALFYTFKTKDGHEVSLTGNHGIFVYLPQTNEIQYLRASQVTLKHQLIMYRKKVPIESISLNKRQGYYSPLTLSSYLYVNNISTSVFVDNYHLSPDDLHTIFLPIRGYYHMMRWFYGKTYNPFETNVKENVHPLIALMKYHQNKIRNIYLYLQFIFQILTL